MILGESSAAAVVPAQPHGALSIDEIFRSVAQRRPDALAVADAPNRETFTDGAPRRLTYAQADRIVDAIAARLRLMGLPTDAVVGIQLPNIVENVLTILGVMRAGMIAAPLPLLWRRADAVAALTRVGSKALVTCGHVGRFNHGQLALRVAVEVFSIRYVCGFGANLPDGAVSFDDLFTAATVEPIRPLGERRNNGAAHVAVVSFDTGAGGLVPVARSHVELLAGGLEVLLEGRLARGGAVLSTVAPSSFAGICLTMLPWLLAGGALLLHHPFNSNILSRQWRDDRFAALILPGTVALRLAATGAFAGDGPTCVIAPWRSPELLAASPDWPERNASLVDVAVFGETGLIAGRRDVAGRPASLPLGPLAAPRGSADGVVVAELVQTETKTLALRGPMVPRHAFPPGIDRSDLPHFKIGADSLVDTGYTCLVRRDGRTMAVTAPPSEFASVGGCRFSLDDLQDVVRRTDSGATVEAVPDALLGQRLTATAGDRAAIYAALNTAGFNPLVVGAFA